MAIDLEATSDSAGGVGGDAGVEVVDDAASPGDDDTARNGDEDYDHFDASTSKGHDSADHESAGRDRWPVRGRSPYYILRLTSSMFRCFATMVEFRSRSCIEI